MNAMILIFDPVANCLKKDLLISAVCVLVTVSEKEKKRKLNVEENHCNEQLVENTNAVNTWYL